MLLLEAREEVPVEVLALGTQGVHQGEAIQELQQGKRVLQEKILETVLIEEIQERKWLKEKKYVIVLRSS